MHVFKILLFISWWSISMQVLSQEAPPLERIISLDLNHQTIPQVLERMEREGNYEIAYSSSLIDTSIRITRNYNDIRTRAILEDLFQGTIYFKTRGNYIILKPLKVENKTISLQGYVLDRETGEGIPYATLYDTLSLSSSISDEFGYFFIDLKRDSEAVLSIRKEGYRDTLTVPSTSKTNYTYIYLTALQDTTTPLNRLEEWLEEFKKENPFKLSDRQKEEMRNIRNELKKEAQVSVVPGISTNGRLNSSTAVNYSFNLIGGTTGSVHEVEVGLLFNRVVDTMRYVQIAGLFNEVGGYQEGVQIAGILNINHTTLIGSQVAGIANISRQNLRGAQVAGVFNKADSIYGSQISGIANAANYLVGSQVGFINRSRYVKGNQVGFINLSDKIEGVPVGFYSYSRKGYHQLEIAYTETDPLSFAYRTGVHAFYNSFLFSIDPWTSNATIWSIGYGLGTSIGLGYKHRLFFDFEARNLQQNRIDASRVFKGTFGITYEFKPWKGVAIGIGPTINAHFAPIDIDTGELNAFNHHRFTHTSFQNNDMQGVAWVGGKIGLRLF